MQLVSFLLKADEYCDGRAAGAVAMKVNERSNTFPPNHLSPRHCRR
jgi:hypothetical protein